MRGACICASTRGTTARRGSRTSSAWRAPWPRPSSGSRRTEGDDKMTTVKTVPVSGHAARFARAHCLAPGRVDAPVHGGRYRSLFPDLPALEVDEAALHALGRPGGPCDLGIDFADDADSHVAAVWPFFGQYVAHDIT